MPVVKTCEICGSLFEVPPVRAEKARFCSVSCRGEGTAKKYAELRVSKTCEVCGKVFDLPKCHANRGDGRFCSKECHRSAQVGNSFGKRAEQGAVVKASEGYLFVRDDAHPFNKNGYVFQHRHVIERELIAKAPDHHFLVNVDGRLCLRREIAVHHVNMNRSDNRVKNLIACTPAGHLDLHAGKTPMRGETWPEAVVVDAEPRNISVTCEKCGTVFSVKRSTYKLRGARFCSNSCASGYEGDLPSIIESECLVCGKKFPVKRHKYLNGVGKFCSNECRHKARVGVSPSHKFNRKE